jgi:2-polyprenyl-3-methyl-5-hydroxy-6-metoxy-1,4-benzoquinol methylase
MEAESERVEIACALCGPEVPSRVRYPERIQETAIDFAARKRPARRHFRVVECQGCGLVYSTPILPPHVISRLYRDSPFIQEAQLSNMGRDYQDQIRRLLPLLPRKKRLLEIGCANGFFLRLARQLGFEEVWGVEPGKDAVQRADPDIRSRIVNVTFSADLFPPESFDMACCFQVLDHLLSPNAVLSDVHRLLRPGGLVLLINHNIRSWFPRLLGERCPMYDIEHIYLFDKQTVSQLLRKNGFEIITVHNTPNSYTLSYAAKMFPLPRLLKRSLGWLLTRTGLGNYRLRLPAGNMATVGRKGILES